MLATSFISAQALAPHYTILYYTILYYTILYYTILYYTILYYTILYYTILYYTILYYTILYYTILYYTILYYTILPWSDDDNRKNRKHPSVTHLHVLVPGLGSHDQKVEIDRRHSPRQYSIV